MHTIEKINSKNKSSLPPKALQLISNNKLFGGSVLNGAHPSDFFRNSFLEAAQRRGEINKNTNCILKCD